METLYWNTRTKSLYIGDKNEIDFESISDKGAVHSRTVHSNNKSVFMDKLPKYDIVDKEMFVSQITGSGKTTPICPDCQCDSCLMARELTCIGCSKTPDQLLEYKYNGSDMSAKEFLIDQEMTLNKFEKDKFYCTLCYCKAGEPMIPKRILKKGAVLCK